MLSLIDPAAMHAALPTLAPLPRHRVEDILNSHLADMTHVLIIEPDDTEEDIIADIGFSPLEVEGIRYGAIEALCRAQGVGFELRRIPKADVLAADELLLSSATKELLPITRLDGQPVGNGRPGPIFEKLQDGYQRAKDALFQT